jgi:transcriptional regulator with XRE-family HTH domain
MVNPHLQDMQTQHPLRQWRTRHKISLVELAGRVCSTAATLSRIERAMHLPRKGLLRNIHYVTGISGKRLMLAYLDKTDDQA